MHVTAGSFYCGSKIKYTTAEPAHHCQTITNHYVLCTFINKMCMRFELELLGMSDIRHRNDKLVENFLVGMDPSVILRSWKAIPSPGVADSSR
jgi:hypothetical protein